MKYSILTAPKIEPVSLADAKMHIRAICGDTTEDEAIISPLITAAREYCENITGRALAEQIIEAYPDKLTTKIYLPRPPLVSIVSIQYTNECGAETTISPENYITDMAGGCVAFKKLPQYQPDIINPVKITYRAGYTDLPKTIRQAMLLMIGHWYANRETVAVGALASVEIKLTTDALLKQYKVWWF